jgi:hypothetical protein
MSISGESFLHLAAAEIRCSLNVHGTFWGKAQWLVVGANIMDNQVA